MKLLLENWREYLNEEQQALDLVEEIWSGTYVTKTLLVEEQIKLLEEGVGSFFSSSFNSVKKQIQNLNNWKDNQLMAFVDSSLKKLQDFFSSMRSVAVKTKNKILQKLFPKYRSRQIVQAFGVLRSPKYLKAGAAILAIVLQKLVELGAKAILDAMSGGAATAAKIATFVQQNLEKIKLLIQAVSSALDPAGILTILKDVAESQGWLQTLIDLKSDLKNPLRGFERGLSTS